MWLLLLVLPLVFCYALSIALAFYEVFSLQKHRKWQFSIRAILSLTAAAALMTFAITDHWANLIFLPIVWSLLHFSPELVVIVVTDVCGIRRKGLGLNGEQRQPTRRRKWWLRPWKNRYIAGRSMKSQRVPFDYPS